MNVGAAPRVIHIADAVMYSGNERGALSGSRLRFVQMRLTGKNEERRENQTSELLDKMWSPKGEARLDYYQRYESVSMTQAGVSNAPEVQGNHHLIESMNSRTFFD